VTKSRSRLAIFDCDRTLVDSQANICMAMEHAFEGAGRTPPLRSCAKQGQTISPKAWTI
jgi:phosphoglycolate phosphatase